MNNYKYIIQYNNVCCFRLFFLRKLNFMFVLLYILKIKMAPKYLISLVITIMFAIFVFFVLPEDMVIVGNSKGNLEEIGSKSIKTIIIITNEFWCIGS